MSPEFLFVLVKVFASVLLRFLLKTVGNGHFCGLIVRRSDLIAKKKLGEPY